MKGKCTCHTPTLNEETLQWAFVTAFNRILEDRETYVAEYDAIIEAFTDTAKLDEQAERLNAENIETYRQIQALIDENARIAQNQDEYHKRYEPLDKLYAEQQQRLNEIAAERQSLILRREKISRFLSDLCCQENLLTEFDEPLCRATLDCMTVYTEKDVAVRFKDGTVIHVDCLGK